MKRLLSERKNRRYNFIELLVEANDWVKLSDASITLGYSDRILREDILYLRGEFDQFVIETGNKGVRIKLKSNEGLRSISQKLLRTSQTYQILETIFFHPYPSVDELSDAVYLSRSTVYREIEFINNTLNDMGFRVDTNPCRIVGDEKHIRHFFNVYFLEKYSYVDFPFKNIDEAYFDNFLKYSLAYNNTSYSFSYYNMFKLMTAVNLTRYQQGFLINVKPLNLNFDVFLTRSKAEFALAKVHFKVAVDETFMEQVWEPFSSKNFFLNREQFLTRIEENDELRIKVDFLSYKLDCICELYDIELNNKEELIVKFLNKIHLDGKDPYSDTILFNRYKRFYLQFEENFPQTSYQLMTLIEDYCDLSNIKLSENSAYYYFHCLANDWKHLMLQLNKTLYTIKILVISEISSEYALMIKDYIELEATFLLEVDVFGERHFDEGYVFEQDYEIYVTDFPLHINHPHQLYIEGVPEVSDLNALQKIIDDIVRVRKQER